MLKNKIKKTIYLGILFLFSVCVLVACTVNLGSYPINFFVDGEIYDIIETGGNEILELPINPIKSGYNFMGWFYDNDVWEKEFTKSSFESIELRQEINIYAKFVQKEKITVQNPTYSGKTLYYEDSLPTITTATTGGSISLKSNQVLQAGIYEYDWIFTPNDFNNYEYYNTEGKIELKVEKLVIDKIDPIYNGGKLCIGDDLPRLISTSSNRGELSLNLEQTLILGKNDYKWTFVPYDTQNYIWNNLTGIITLDVEKSRYIIPSDVELSINYLTEKIIRVDELGENYEYSIDNNNWQSSNKFDCLDENTAYIVYARIKQDDIFSESLPLIEEVTTLNTQVLKKYFKVEGTSISGLTDLGRIQSQIVVPQIIDGKLINIIQYNAFKNCNDIYSVILQDTIMEIGENAFDGCYNLRRIEMPAGLQKIGRYAFKDCGNLPSIYISNKVNKIEYSILYGATNLQSITLRFPSDFVYDFSWLFGSSASDVPNSLKTVILTGGKIGYSQFKNCKSIETIIAKDCSSIEESAFANCTNLNKIILPTYLTKLSNYMFENCTSLKSIEIPQNVDNMGTYAFRNCIMLKTIKMSNNIKYIGTSTFNNCSSLENIVLPEKLLTIGDYAFNDCKSLKQIIIPSSVVEIGNLAFYNCNIKVYCRPNNNYIKWSYNWNYSGDGRVLHYFNYTD